MFFTSHKRRSPMMTAHSEFRHSLSSPPLYLKRWRDDVSIPHLLIFHHFECFVFFFFQKKSVGSSIFLFYVSLLFIYWKRHQPFTNPWILIKLKLIHELIDYYNFKKKIVLLCSNSFCLSWDDGAVYITMWWMLTVLSVEFIVASGNTKKTCQPVTLIISFHLLKMCCNVAPVQLKRPPTQLETVCMCYFNGTGRLSFCAARVT